MSYYNALINAWNGATQPPAGVIGIGLTAGMTLAQKLAAVNGWTVTGSVPTTLFVTGVQLLNCINYAEFKALTAQQQSNLLALCSNDGLILGGSSNTAFLADGMILDYFTNHSGPTIVALTALAQASSPPWWQANSYPGPFNGSDLVASGLATLVTVASTTPGSEVLTFSAVPSWVIAGMEVHDLGTDQADIPVGTTVASTTATTVTLTKAVMGTGIALGDTIGFV